MACGLGLCACNPYTLILGRLSLGPALPEELEALAGTVYGEGSCWGMEDYRVVLGFLVYAGMVRLEGGKLRLALRDPHDREYAEVAKKTLLDAGLISAG